MVHRIAMLQNVCRWLVVAVVAIMLVVPAGNSFAKEETFEVLRDQGVHYFRRKMLKPAISSLEKAAALPGGENDYRTHFFLARSYVEELVIEKALPAARRAVELAKEEGEKNDSQTLLNGLEEFYGGVTFRMAPEQEGRLSAGYIHLDDRGGLIAVDKKEVFDKIKERFSTTPVTLPITIYLPGGEFAANRAPFVVTEGSEENPEVEIILYNEGERLGLSPWWFVGGGVAAAAVAATVAAIVFGGGDDGDVQRVSFGDISFNAGAQ